jgi:N-acetylmuramoyl-L-alanine amidase
VAFAARSEFSGRDARLIFSLTACPPVEAYVLDAPARAIVDLPEVNFQIDAPPTDGHAALRRHARPKAREAAQEDTRLIASYRFGRISAGKSRIVVDLAGPAEIKSLGCTNGEKYAELILALAPQGEAAFHAAARVGAQKQASASQKPGVADKAPDQPQAPSAAAPSADKDAKKLIMLDPGHGGIDSGAHGRDDAVEKVVVLEFAKALAAKLRESGHYRVLMTREDDTFVPLGERVRMARKSGADLFISLHADALAGHGAGVQGATVYTVSDRASDAEAARVAEHENMVDSAAGVDAREETGDVNDILFDLTRRETRAFSHSFAHSLTEYWKVAARLNKNPRRAAGFVVLKAPDVPSVLLELGYLSDPADEAELTSPAWRARAAAQAAAAVDSYFAPRSAGPLNRP